MALTRESFLPDEADCAETWRAVRWPDGVICVACGSQNVGRRTTNYRGHLYRYCCRDCGKWFSDVTDTMVAHSNLSLAYWVYLIREMDKGRALNDIYEEMGLTYATVWRMAKVIRQSHYIIQQVDQQLSGEVEGDDIHVKGGRQGKECDDRPPRERGLKERGRGTYAGDRPLVCLWTERGSPRIAITMLPDAGKRTLFNDAHRHTAPGSRVDTDSWRGYNLLGHIYDHHTVKHSECYVAEDGTHCNTAEAEWSIFKPWWVRFRGVAKRYIHLYLAQYEFERCHRELSRLERTESVLGALYTCWLRLMQMLFWPANNTLLVAL